MIQIAEVKMSYTNMYSKALSIKVTVLRYSLGVMDTHESKVNLSICSIKFHNIKYF